MFIQNQKIPPSTYASFEINSFEYGLNNVKSAFELRPGESPDLLNVIALEEGSIETRPGLFKYVAQQIGETIQKIFVYETDTIHMFLLSSATKLYKINIDGTSLAEVCTVSSVISGVQLETMFYFVDGAKYRVYDGTDVYEIIEPIMLTGTAQAGAGTSITLPSSASSNNDYYNGFTVYISSGTGSGQSRVISDYVGSTKVATVPNWSVTPDNTSVIYLTQTAQGTLTTDAVNKTKCYSPSYLEFDDEFKGANNINMIKLCTKLTLHKSRMWFAVDSTHPNIIYSTDIDNMYYSPVNNYYPPVTSNDDNVNGIYSFNDVLVIFKKHTAFALYGYDYTDYELKEITVPTGTSNINTVCKANNYLYYLGSDGVIYSMYDVRTDIKKMMAKSISSSIDLIKYPINAYPDTWGNAFACYYNGYYFLSVDDKLLVYKLDRGWFLWDTIEPTCFIVYNNDLLLMNADRYIYRSCMNRFYVEETFTASASQTDFTVTKGWMNSTREDVNITVDNVAVNVNDAELKSRTVVTIPACSAGQTVKIAYVSLRRYVDGTTAYDSYWKTHDMDLNYHSQVKQIRNVYASIIAIDFNNTTLNFNAYIDYADVTGSVSVTNSVSLWGTALFGEKFKDRNTVVPEVFPVNRRGKIIQFKFSTSGANQPFKVFNINGRAVVRDTMR